MVYEYWYAEQQDTDKELRVISNLVPNLLNGLPFDDLCFYEYCDPYAGIVRFMSTYLVETYMNLCSNDNFLQLVVALFSECPDTLRTKLVDHFKRGQFTRYISFDQYKCLSMADFLLFDALNGAGFTAWALDTQAKAGKLPIQLADKTIQACVSRLQLTCKWDELNPLLKLTTLLSYLLPSSTLNMEHPGDDFRDIIGNELYVCAKHRCGVV